MPLTSTTPWQTRSLDWRHLALILLLAFALRAIWAMVIPVVPVSDAVAYDAFARTLVEHGTFGWTANEPTSFWPPGTTFLHAALFWTFGFRYEPIVVANIGLSLGIVLVSARLADRFWGHRVALLTALVLAVWPTLVMYSTILASELPFLLLTLLALDVWTQKGRHATAQAVLVGLLLGLAALVRPQALLLPFLLAFSTIATGGLSGPVVLQQIRLLLMAGLVMAMVVAPWTWRNHQLYGEPVLISTNGGITLWMGNAPGTDGRYMDVPQAYDHLPENERARILGQEARDHIRQDPLGFASRALRKLVILYGNESVGVGWNEAGIRQALGEPWIPRLKRLTQISWALILALALVGAWASLSRQGWRRTVFSPFTLTIGYFTAIHMVVVSQERYHLAFAGQLALLAAAGGLFLLERLRPTGTAT